MKQQSPKSGISIVKRVLQFLKPYKALLYSAIFLTLFMAFVSPVRPFLVQYTVDKFIIEPNHEKLALYVGIMFGLLLVESLGSYFSIYSINRLGQIIVRDIRVKLFEHLNKLKLAYFDKTPIGTLVTRVVNDLETISSIFTEGLAIVFGDLIQLSVVLTVMFLTSWKLTLISISTIPILLIATNIFKNAIKKTFNEVRNQVAKLNTFVQERLSGIAIVKIFNREETEYDNFKKINAEHRKAHIRSVWYYSVFFPVVEILSAISLGLLIWAGAGEVLKNEVSVGTLVAFTLYINMLFRPIRQLADRFNTLQMGIVSSERVFQVLDTNEIIEQRNQTHTQIYVGKIEFKQVWMAYQNADFVLKDVTFTADEGKTLAIVGATGSGKTTIISLINRFYEFQKGAILIDGMDVLDFDEDSLRRQIAVVQQDVLLFSDSIANNIRLGNAAITDEQILDAVSKVGALKFIEKLPGGIQFNVRERGAMLSAGQRQLISFVRAYLYNPKILILDEATSSLDSETEQMIQIATQTLTQNRTSIIIAHRLATVQHADKIVVLENGCVVETGSHQTLVELNGKYAELYQRQFLKKAQAIEVS